MMGLRDDAQTPQRPAPQAGEASRAEAGAVEVIEPWMPARDLRIEGRTMRAAAYDGATAVCIDDLNDRDCRVVVEALQHQTRPMVDGSGAWAFPGDVERALRRHGA